MPTDVRLISFGFIALLIAAIILYHLYFDGAPVMKRRAAPPAEPAPSKTAHSEVSRPTLR